jgi:putative transposase
VIQVHAALPRERKVSVQRLCATLGVSRQTYYAQKRRDALPAGQPAATRRAQSPRWASAEVVLAAIRTVIADHPAWGVRKVWAMLRREHELRVSRKRVWALMHAHGLVLAGEREPGEPPPRGHVVVPEPNRRWATDLTTVWTARDGWVAITPTIDCGCRSALALVVSKSQDALTVLGSVRNALSAAFGSPELVPQGLELRTDHGPQYTGRECEEMLSHWGVSHTYAPIGRPTGNAVVERFIRTMKEEVVWLRDWQTADELREALERWVVLYNVRRPHQALGWKTPSEYRADKLPARIVAQAA